MLGSAPPLRAPSCLSCTRRLLGTALSASESAARPVLSVWQQQQQQQQVRGKKRSTRGPDTIIAKLLKDTPGYGAAGSYVPLPAGLLRNLFLPQRIATYVLGPERAALRAANVSVQRDVLFQAERVGKTAAQLRRMDRGGAGNSLTLEEGSKAQAKRVGRALRQERRELVGEQVNRLREGGEVQRGDVLLVSPTRSTALLEEFVPQALDFVRDTTGGVASDALFGSVTGADVVQAIREALEGKDEASRVVLGEDDISFAEARSSGSNSVERAAERHEEGAAAQQTLDRLKRVGQYIVTIRVKGAQDVVVRTVNVLTPEQKAAKQAALQEAMSPMERLASELQTAR